MATATAVVRTEKPAPYEACPVPSAGTDESEQYAIDRALAILHKRLFNAEDILSRPADVRQYLCLRLGEQEHESFGCVWLDAQNRVIALEEMFRGTITQASVYPREVVKDALARNAAGVILFHNHPSGLPEPSAADESLTRVICGALKLIDVRVLDHVVVGGTRAVSFAERGLL